MLLPPLEGNPRVELGIDYARPVLVTMVAQINSEGKMITRCPRVVESWEFAGGLGINPGKLWMSVWELWVAGDSVLAPRRAARNGRRENPEDAAAFCPAC
jgi:hypothetical protein